MAVVLVVMRMIAMIMVAIRVLMIRVGVFMVVLVSMFVVVLVSMFVVVLVSMFVVVLVSVLMVVLVSVLMVVSVLVPGVRMSMRHGAVGAALAATELWRDTQRTTAMAAPKPLSMLTTVTPAAQLDNMPSNAAKPPCDTP